MAVRVTDADVKEIIDVQTSRDTSIFINLANRFVDLHLLPEGISEGVLTDIELYLAAHFTAITVERGGLTSEVTGDSEASYANVYEAGFGSTRYGQIALTLDSSGKLRDLGTPALKAMFTVV